MFENFAMNHRKRNNRLLSSVNRVDGLSISLLHFEGSEFVITRDKNKSVLFFEYFDSLIKIFDAIRVVDIEERNICDEPSGVSSVRLALMCMNYQ
ncbi:hypothetical protein MJ568_02945 [Escherichia coli]|nr:hypothetical protein MJ568_02945 [Escherichia coli]